VQNLPETYSQSLTEPFTELARSICLGLSSQMLTGDPAVKTLNATRVDVRQHNPIVWINGL
jgi:hypothetical protein